MTKTSKIGMTKGPGFNAVAAKKSSRNQWLRVLGADWTAILEKVL
jgi:hypothetical protein